jgi:hypothetical protein
MSKDKIGGNIVDYFINVANLSDLEKRGSWDDAKKLLYELWLSNKDDAELAIRLGTECWYVLVEWELIENDNLCYESFNNTLREVTNYGLKRFKEDNKFLSIFGYMITTFPFLFGEDESYEELGKSMLKNAYIKNPTNLITKTLYLGSTSNIQEYILAIRETVEKYDLNQLFKDSTAIEVYFKEVIFNIKNIVKLE